MKAFYFVFGLCTAVMVTTPLLAQSTDLGNAQNIVTVSDDDDMPDGDFDMPEGDAEEAPIVEPKPKPKPKRRPKPKPKPKPAPEPPPSSPLWDAEADDEPDPVVPSRTNRQTPTPNEGNNSLWDGEGADMDEPEPEVAKPRRRPTLFDEDYADTTAPDAIEGSRVIEAPEAPLPDTVETEGRNKLILWTTLGVIGGTVLLGGAGYGIYLLVDGGPKGSITVTAY